MSYYNGAESSAVSSSVLWVQSALMGTVASAVALIAVATVGLMMLNGSLDIRRGARTILGCFLVFGASTIADAFLAVTKSDANPAPMQLTPPPPPVLPPVLPPAAAYDPYAGAAVPSRQ